MDYIVETDFQGPGFVAVPNAVAQNDLLSAEALGVLVFLASKPHGFLTRVTDIQERFGFGKDKWQRIAKELRDAGAMVVEPVRGRGGRVIGKRVSIRWPENATSAESRKTRLSDREPEKPTVGKSAKQGRKIRQTGPENPAPYKEKEKDRARAPARDRPTPTSNKTDRRVALDELNDFVKKEIREGKSVVMDDGNGKRLLKPGDPDFDRLHEELTSGPRVQRKAQELVASYVHQSIGQGSVQPSNCDENGEGFNQSTQIADRASAAL